MQVDRLKPELVDRLLVLEKNAAHLTVMADVAAAYAHVAREKADAAQAVLSQCKVFLALLPDGAKLELRAPLPDADNPAKRLGVRLPVLQKRNMVALLPPPVPRSDRKQKPLRHPLSRLSMMRGTYAPTTRPAESFGAK